MCLSVMWVVRAVPMKRDELERMAELAVVEAAERAAERAVEKSLESGNTTSTSRMVKHSHESTRLNDKTIQLKRRPTSGFTTARSDSDEDESDFELEETGRSGGDRDFDDEYEERREPVSSRNRPRITKSVGESFAKFKFPFKIYPSSYKGHTSFSF